MTVLKPRPGPSEIPTGLDMLRPFIDAGVFGAYEVQFVATVCRLHPGLSDLEVLALAVAARAPSFGHVCTVLDDVAGLTADLDAAIGATLPWPDPATWAVALVHSSVVSTPGSAGDGPLRPLVWDAGRLYLRRYWHYELVVADSLIERSWSGSGAPGVVRPDARNLLDGLFAAGDTDGADLQRQAAERGLRPGVSIIAGGPGTGKTHTVARLLAAAHLVGAAEGRVLQVALAAPTGKAAARMGDAVRAAVQTLEVEHRFDSDLADTLVRTEPTTVHALLGWRDRTHFRHDRQRPLPHDIVIVDETSMVSLPLMAKLLDAVRPEARLVLVGDPFQLASIEAGTVMSDVVGPMGEPGAEAMAGDAPLDGRITVLTALRRFEATSTIASVADAIRRGDADSAMVLLADGAADLRWVRPDDTAGLDQVVAAVVAEGIEMVEAAQRGDASTALAGADRVKVLAATRRGRLGMDDWTERIEGGVALGATGFQPGHRWQAGRPVLVTGNDRMNRLFNGDTGVAVSRGDRVEVVVADGSGLRFLAPSRLDRVETWWAMTIHKSQGSEFSHAVVSLPLAGSPILTRELLYTAVTRARDTLTVVASEDSLRSAITRPVARASGLRDRLWPS
jgi:exodeoxyribonuclease V alpha subunit